MVILLVHSPTWSQAEGWKSHPTPWPCGAARGMDLAFRNHKFDHADILAAMLWACKHCNRERTAITFQLWGAETSRSSAQSQSGLRQPAWLQSLQSCICRNGYNWTSRTGTLRRLPVTWHCGLEKCKFSVHNHVASCVISQNEMHFAWLLVDASIFSIYLLLASTPSLGAYARRWKFILPKKGWRYGVSRLLGGRTRDIEEDSGWRGVLEVDDDEDGEDTWEVGPVCQEGWEVSTGLVPKVGDGPRQERGCSASPEMQ